MSTILVIASGVAALAIASYLAWLLLSIRRMGYGEGRLLELPHWGFSLRYPRWWQVEVTGDVSQPGIPSVQFWTGHRRGLLRIEACGTGSAASEVDDLRPTLREILIRKGVVLDEMGIRTEAIGPPRGSTDTRTTGPTRSGATVASGGRESSSSDERRYFEYHLVRIGRTLILFSYTNSVLQGFLDAFYIEKMMGTIDELEHPGRYSSSDG